MKLSNIKGERTFEVIVSIIDPIANLATDAEVSKLFRREKLPEGLTVKEFAVQRIKNGAPLILGAHRTDIIAILSAIEGISPEEYTEGLTFAKLISDFVELVTDETFTQLFISAGPAGKEVPNCAK